MKIGDLEGRVIAVLGVGPGIGLETVRLLAEMGARVVCVDIDKERAAAAAQASNGLFIVGDILTTAGFDKVLAALDHIAAAPLAGVIDVVGGSIGGRLADADEELVGRNYQLNLGHAFRVVRSFGERIGVGGGGSMVFVGSLAGVVSSPHQAVYGSAKAALHHLVRSAGVELGERGVRVNAVAPGLVATPRMLERYTADEFERFRSASPLGRIVQPQDIAKILAFLVSDLSGAITSQTIVADGGFSAQPRMF